MKTHKEKPKITCFQCGKSDFYSRGQLKNHMKVHLRETAVQQMVEQSSRSTDISQAIVQNGNNSLVTELNESFMNQNSNLSTNLENSSTGEEEEEVDVDRVKREMEEVSEHVEYMPWNMNAILLYM